jgi:hypothetical protein
MDLEGRSDAQWAAMGQDEHNSPEVDCDAVVAAAKLVIFDALDAQNGNPSQVTGWNLQALADSLGMEAEGQLLSKAEREYELIAEHENGEHMDTRRGECPECEEAFGHDTRTSL